MDETAAVARAEQLWRNGRRAQALELLKLRVRRAPDESAARLALAGLYRELGAPDQAGRWGIVFADWTTPLERDRLARLLGASGVRVADVPEFLALPSHSFPDRYAEVLEEAERYRERYRVTSFSRDFRPPAENWQAVGAFGTWGVALAGGLVVVLVVWAGAVLGASMVGFARWSSLVLAAVLAVGCALAGWDALRDRRRTVGAAWLAGALLLSVGVALATSVGVANGGVLRLAWEG
ncbi:DUF6584 family protein [Rathayibacter sp. VKM Ac-2857]|uniref:DUF6584 family protein n=1 Tax=Rathayibacter sp. VKM Ac-2857 TaxID=2739020 RepID=UPI00156595F5|nr:DUF6584 family protein [Rathayibacter sp. VKM Ac-2857]NQX15733.1 hypothetical protein [Rathayibacter sp. VKM Ac-2857]